MADEFRIGDTVRCISNADVDDILEVGQLYIVLGIVDSDSGQYLRIIPNAKPGEDGFYTSRFERVRLPSNAVKERRRLVI